MTTQQARAFWVAAPGRGEVRSESLPPCGSTEVMVRAMFSGISRGTESLVFKGQVPASEHERMRAPFQAGVFPAPVKYGYASVGLVVEGPDHLVGRHVFTLFPHQTFYVVPAAAVHVLPDGVPPPRAILTANLETAINGIWDASPHVGDRVVVIGGGAVGCLTAWLAGQMPGAEVTLVDVNARRADTARALGIGFATPEQAPVDADVVIHASGSGSGLELALEIAGYEATIVEMSWFGARTVSLPLGEAFHVRRLTIKSSQVGHVAATQRARWDTGRRMQLALKFLGEAALEVLITGESAFEDLPETMAGLAETPGDALCHRIRYQ
jgi:2-desacetyl-2-hydroxyethyl bacteriochlorophyllide A dehydrogenase